MVKSTRRDGLAPVPLPSKATRSVQCEFDLGMDDFLAVLSSTADNVDMLDSIRAQVGDDPRAWLPMFYRQVHDRRTSSERMKQLVTITTTALTISCASAGAFAQPTAAVFRATKRCASSVASEWSRPSVDQGCTKVLEGRQQVPATVAEWRGLHGRGHRWTDGMQLRRAFRNRLHCTDYRRGQVLSLLDSGSSRAWLHCPSRVPA